MHTSPRTATSAKVVCDSISPAGVRLTDLVVVGEGAGSKEQKARELGIEIMAASDFAAMVARSAQRAPGGQ